MKIKFNVKGGWKWASPFIDLLQGRRDEIILRADEQLKYIADAADKASQIEGCDAEMLKSMMKILNLKIGLPGTKAQLKPTFDADGQCEKLNIIVKWGGEVSLFSIRSHPCMVQEVDAASCSSMSINETDDVYHLLPQFTHSGRYQSRDIGENMRKDLTIMNKAILKNVSISSSSERRAIATAEIFGSAILDHHHQRQQATAKTVSPPSAPQAPEAVSGTNGSAAAEGVEDGSKIAEAGANGGKSSDVSQPHRLIIRKDLLDDSNAAKEPMDKVKKRLKVLLRPGEYKRPEFARVLSRVPDVEPQLIVQETVELMKYHRASELHRSNIPDLDSSVEDVKLIDPFAFCSHVRESETVGYRDYPVPMVLF